MRVFHRTRSLGTDLAPGRIGTDARAHLSRPAGAQQREDPGPVLVAVDDSDRDGSALEWAAAEAAARMCVLRIVHTFTWPLMLDSLGTIAFDNGDCATKDAAELVVETAAARARLIAPELQVTTHLQEGATTPAILRECRGAALVVLGRGGRSGGLIGALAGSPTTQVTRLAACPVAVIGSLHDAPPGPSAARVVVGVDGTPASTSALGFAFRAAQRRGIGITVLHAWLPGGAAYLHAALDDPISSANQKQRSLDDALAAWRDAFPEVDVRSTLVPAPAGPALVAESGAAALLVVGSRARGRLHSTFFGSVAHTVLRSAHSPTAVVRASDPDAGTSLVAGAMA